MKKITLYLLVFVACMVASASAAAEHHDHEQTPTTPHHQYHWPWWLSVPWWRRVPPPPPSNVHHHNYSPSRPAPSHHQRPPHGHHNTPPARFSGNCSTALIYTDGCTRDLITSFFDEEKISVGGACCRTISGLSDDCFQEAFTQFKSPRFTRAVRDFCAHRHFN
ncbi:hypothetical protein ABFS83_02G059200 [Erythranthe nasuta]